MVLDTDYWEHIIVCWFHLKTSQNTPYQAGQKLPSFSIKSVLFSIVEAPTKTWIKVYVSGKTRTISAYVCTPIFRDVSHIFNPHIPVGLHKADLMSLICILIVFWINVFCQHINTSLDAKFLWYFYTTILTP